MMKFAQFMCGQCRKPYDSHIDSGAYMPCPTCGQFNPVTAASPSITGRCVLCGKPLESAGHVWWHDQFTECKNGAKN